MAKKNSGSRDNTGASGDIPFDKAKLPPERVAFLKSLRGRLDKISPHLDGDPDFREQVVAGAMSEVAKQVLPERVARIKQTIGPETEKELHALCAKQDPQVDFEGVLAAVGRRVHANTWSDVLQDPEILITTIRGMITEPANKQALFKVRVTPKNHTLRLEGDDGSPSAPDGGKPWRGGGGRSA